MQDVIPTISLLVQSADARFHLGLEVEGLFRRLFTIGAVVTKETPLTGLVPAIDVAGQIVLLLLALAVLIVGSALLGLGLQFLLGVDGRLADGLGPSLGLGVSLIVVSTSLSLLLLNTLVLGAALAFFAAGLGWILKIRELFRFGAARRTIHQRLSRCTMGARSDAALLAVSLIIFAPLLRHGATVWSYRTWDFTTHVGFVQVALGQTPSGRPFSTVHPGAFGDFISALAVYERPATTAFLALLQQVTGLSPLYLMAPIMIFLAFGAAAAMASAIRRIFCLSSLTSTLIVTLTLLAVVPITRLLDGQVAHGLAIFLLCSLFAFVCGGFRLKNVTHLVARGVVVGLLLSASLATNLVVALSLLPILASLCLVVCLSDGKHLKSLGVTTGVAGVTCVILSAPFISRFVTTWVMNTGENYGYPIAFPTPFALFGLQTVVQHSTPITLLLITWLLVIAIAIAALTRLRAPLASRIVAISIPVYVISLCSYILNTDDENSYKAHKFMAGVIAILAPPALAALAHVWKSRLKMVNASLIALAIVSVAFSIRAAESVGYVIPRDLLTLGVEERLRNVDLLVLNLGNPWENETAAIVVPSPLVLIEPSATDLDSFCVKEFIELVRIERMSEFPDAIPLNASYAYVHRTCA